MTAAAGARGAALPIAWRELAGADLLTTLEVATASPGRTPRESRADDSATTRQPAAATAHGSDDDGVRADVDPLDGAVTAATPALVAALAASDVPGTKLAVRALAGLGPGSTPAGDDVLVGALLGLSAARAGASPAPCLGAAVARAAAGRTTADSWAWIAAAARGAALAPWHQLVTALAAGDATSCRLALERIRALGATSGRHAAAAFLATVRACLGASPTPTAAACALSPPAPSPLRVDLRP